MGDIICSIGLFFSGGGPKPGGPLGSLEPPIICFMGDIIWSIGLFFSAGGV
jgi:hypothetical protein